MEPCLREKKIVQNSLFKGFDPIEIDSRGHFSNFIAFSLSRMNRIISKPRKSGKQERREKKNRILLVNGGVLQNALCHFYQKRRRDKVVSGIREYR